MIRRPPRSTQSRSSAASDVYKRQVRQCTWVTGPKSTHARPAPPECAVTSSIARGHTVPGGRECATTTSWGAFSPTMPHSHSTIRGLFEIARVDHWFKNVFVLPGVVVALGFAPLSANASAIESFLMRLVLGLVAICLVASSNYVLNEVMDAPFDRHHPEKSQRPVPLGRVN